MAEEFHFEDVEAIRPAVLPYGVMIATADAVSLVEAWLDDHCDGAWNLEVEGLGDDLMKKELRISFELDADKTRFISDYAQA
ncbi:MAG: hypothetical protein OXR84_00695 [Magnetovibrio sp.]|nr:hypothetical protein [Magnetovibrio sp.]